jgi:predicted short-subunit dehydrogenase-like oxidoreductase (DUF2520 family)
MIQYNISFAGAGRVAGALCSVFAEKNHKIQHIVSLTEKSGRELSDIYGASWSSDPVFPDSTDIIIVSVPDHALESVLRKIKCRQETIVAHTAGSIGLDVFPQNIMHKAVFYPLQTFTRNRKISFQNLPVFIESSDIESSGILEALASDIGAKVYYADTEHRRVLHLAAVFVANFTNHMLTCGNTVAGRAGFSFDILGPLVRETIAKASDIGPENSQTGPAVRNDMNTINKHLDLLSFSPELKSLYSELTNSIIKHYNIS